MDPVLGLVERVVVRPVVRKVDQIGFGVGLFTELAGLLRWASRDAAAGLASAGIPPGTGSRSRDRLGYSL